MMGVSYDPVLADRIQELIPFEADHTEAAMFGGLAFLVGGTWPWSPAARVA